MRQGMVVVWLAVSVHAVSAHEIKVFSSRGLLPVEGGKATVYLAWGHRVPVDELVDASPIERYEHFAPGGAVTKLKAESMSLQANAVDLKAPGVHTALVVRKPGVMTYVRGDAGDLQMKRGPRSDHAGAAIAYAHRSQQFGKCLIVVGEPSETVPAAVGLGLEIVPQDGPARWRVGHDMRFQMHKDGKPAAVRTTVEARDLGFKPDDAWCYATETSGKGEFTIRFSRPGTWVIKTSVQTPAAAEDRAQFDYRKETTTLTFEVLP